MRMLIDDHQNTYIAELRPGRASWGRVHIGIEVKIPTRPSGAPSGWRTRHAVLMAMAIVLGHSTRQDAEIGRGNNLSAVGRLPQQGH